MTTHEVLMPCFDPDGYPVTLRRWLVKEGDVVQPGDALAEVEADKADLELEAFVGGRVARIMVPEGRLAMPFTVLAVVEVGPNVWNARDVRNVRDVRDGRQ